MMDEVTGVMFNYYFVCKRKLWYFANHINLEDEHENVKIGKTLDETSYSRERKDILIDDTINIDFIRDKKEVHEVKKSRSIEEAAIWQLKYYLYYLHKKGLKGWLGKLDYPLLRKNIEVVLEKDDFQKIEKIQHDIADIIKKETPPQAINSRICKKCAYYELCYI